ncbi:MAG: sugar transferase [Candidatus Omnitrophota bacterium]
MKKFYYVLLLIAFLILIDPVHSNQQSLATMFMGNYPAENQEVNISGISTLEIYPIQASSPEHGLAPEPSSFILFLSGIFGFIVHFIRKSYEKFKRFLDIFLAVLGLVIASPLIILISLLIKFTSKGPIIYKQNRVGRRGEVFKIYKFRSMDVDAENDTGAVWATDNDPRITGLGRVLRKFHLDEIPQLINVIMGEMSIVGPRPERPEIVNDLKKAVYDYEKRLKVKPGITGLAQVVHKYDQTLRDVRGKIKYDLLYMKKLGLGVDLKIMLKTLLVVMKGKGAR